MLNDMHINDIIISSNNSKLEVVFLCNNILSENSYLLDDRYAYRNRNRSIDRDRYTFAVTDIIYNINNRRNFTNEGKRLLYYINNIRGIINVRFQVDDINTYQLIIDINTSITNIYFIKQCVFLLLKDYISTFHSLTNKVQKIIKQNFSKSSCAYILNTNSDARRGGRYYAGDIQTLSFFNLVTSEKSHHPKLLYNRNWNNRDDITLYKNLLTKEGKKIFKSITYDYDVFNSIRRIEIEPYTFMIFFDEPDSRYRLLNNMRQNHFDIIMDEEDNELVIFLKHISRYTTASDIRNIDFNQFNRRNFYNPFITNGVYRSIPF